MNEKCEGLREKLMNGKKELGKGGKEEEGEKKEGNEAIEQTNQGRER